MCDDLISGRSDHYHRKGYASCSFFTKKKYEGPQRMMAIMGYKGKGLGRHEQGSE